MEKDRSSVTEPLMRAVLVETFRSEVNAWAQRIRVEPKEIRLRSMKRICCSMLAFSIVPQS